MQTSWKFLLRHVSSQEVDEKLRNSSFMQLLYDEKKVNRRERFLFVAQYYDGDKCSRFDVAKIAMVYFDSSYTLFTFLDAKMLSIFIPLGKVNLLRQSSFMRWLFLCSLLNRCRKYVMADTTSKNTGKAKGISNRLAAFFKENVGHGIHVLECQFHVNELLLGHTVKFIEGKSVAPDRMAEESVYNLIQKVKPTEELQLLNCSISVFVTARGLNSLRSTLIWVAETEGSRTKCFLLNRSNSLTCLILDDRDFRDDQVCLLILACKVVGIDIPAKLERFLFYKKPYLLQGTDC